MFSSHSTVSRHMALALWLCVVCCGVFCGGSRAASADTGVVTNISVVVSSQGQTTYGQAAAMFAQHLQARCPGVVVQVATVAPASANLVIHAGTAKLDAAMNAWLKQQGPTPALFAQGPPEAYRLAVLAAGGTAPATAWVCGTDARGVLYGLGRLLELSQLRSGGLVFPLLQAEAAPAYAFRAITGSLRANMDSTIREQTGARAWTSAEQTAHIEMSLLRGGNVLSEAGSPVDLALYGQSGYQLSWNTYCNIAVKYGVQYMISVAVNYIKESDVKTEWKVTYPYRQGPLSSLVCPSVAAARQALLQNRQILFQNLPQLDYVLLAAGDIAGCHCSKCEPWGTTYYNLIKDTQAVLKTAKPKAKIVSTNQWFSPAENQSFLGKLEGSSWLGAHCYAPGGSENSGYGWYPTNRSWAVYPGLNETRSFLRACQKALNPNQQLIEMIDMTHWKRSQYCLETTDPIYAEHYERRSFNPRPRAVVDNFLKSAGYLDGILLYSEGIYDDYHKYLISRLIWEPAADFTAISNEYFSYLCGPEQAALMTDTALRMEKNLALPVLSNAAEILQVDAQISQVRAAMGTAYLDKNWRFQMFYEKGLIDHYLLLKNQLASVQFANVTQQIQQLITSHPNDLTQLKATLTTLSGTAVVPSNSELAALKNKIKEADLQLNSWGALRLGAANNLDSIDDSNLGWLQAQLTTLAGGSSTTAVYTGLRAILNYEQVGTGEFYDDLGTVDRQPHYVTESGMGYDGDGTQMADARPSQRSFVFAGGNWPGLEFRYTNLDAGADYQITISTPNPQDRYDFRDSPNEYMVIANGQTLGKVSPSGAAQVDFFTLPLNRSVISNGSLALSLVPVANRCRAVCAGEIWVRKQSSTQSTARNWKMWDSAELKESSIR